MTPVDPKKLEVEALIVNTGLLKGILTVLIDMHTSKMTPEERKKYLTDLKIDMDEMSRSLINTSKV